MKIFLILLLTLSKALAFDIYAPKRVQSELAKKYYEDVIINIYKTIGFDAKIIFVPEAQINSRLKSGEFDAVLGKISDSSNIPNSIQISPPLVKNYKVYRWKLKSKLEVKNKIRIGAIKGVMAHTKTVIKNRARFHGIKYYNTFPELLNGLLSQEVDSILLADIETQNEFDDDFFARIEKVPGLLLVFDISHYINSKHKNIEKSLSLEFLKRDKLNMLNFSDYKKYYLKNKIQKKAQ